MAPSPQHHKWCGESSSSSLRDPFAGCVTPWSASEYSQTVVVGPRGVAWLRSPFPKSRLAGSADILEVMLVLLVLAWVDKEHIRQWTW